MDDRIDRVNANGLFAAPVVLWALPSGQAKQLNPGSYLTVDEVVLLARYIVARYHGNMVIWMLGGDGRFLGDLESRWKEISRGNQAKQTGWKKSIDFPGSLQISYLSWFIQQFEWWKFFPANEILAEQPGDKVYNQWISVVKTADNSQVLAYIPGRDTIKLFNPQQKVYEVMWFDPISNKTSKILKEVQGSIISIDQNIDHDMVLILKAKSR